MQIFGFESYGGPEVARLIEVAEPRCGAGQLLVAMRAAGVNPADVKVRSGERRDTIPVSFPMAMGREAAGVVREVGPQVTGFAVGDEVFGATAAGTGAFAELVVLEAAASATKPSSVPWQQAACLPVSAGTALDVLDQLDLAEGATLLVLGAGGGVGTAALQLARVRGVRVLGVASRAKAELVQDLGAQHIGSGEGWIEAVTTIAPGGVDGLLDLVGGPVLPEAATLVRDRGRIVSVAAPALARELGGSGANRRRTSEVFARLAGQVAAGELTIPITRTFPLARAEGAVAVVESGHAAGKVVVVADAEEAGS